MQPHTDATTTIAANVTLPSSRSEDALKRVDAAESKITRIDSRTADNRIPRTP